jgi:hypothetical protein
MTKISYEQALDDHTYLWSEYGAAEDMTGGYVDSEDLTRLLRSPTKATARSCLMNQIEFWFQNGPDTTGGHGRRPDPDDPRLVEIAERYDHDLDRVL